jgi:cyclic pyranopterin phosphate synthase
MHGDSTKSVNSKGDFKGFIPEKLLHSPLSSRPGKRYLVPVAGMDLRDDHGRVMSDLRVSITDRCNFRCLYCLPETEEAANFYRSKWDALRNPQPQPLPLQPIQYDWKPKSHLLTYEEITRVVRIGVGLGIRKIRLTGGEPLMRRDVPMLVKSLAAMEGIEDLSLIHI